jgi:dTDP-4-amino-4,6-dideoxygalactose transaminase
MIYYPRPLHKQKAFENLGKIVGNLAVSDQLCSEVLSLPIHTEMSIDQLNYITENIKSFFSGK